MADGNTTQTEDPVVTGLKSHIGELEQRVLELKRAVNSLDREKGRTASYGDAELASKRANGTMAIKTDQFLGATIHTAMRQYLTMRRQADLGPATLPEIYDGLVSGGLEFDTENEVNRKINIRSVLRKSSSIFYRLSDKTHFALREWYRGIKNKGDENGDSETKKKKRKKGKRKTPNAAKAAKNAADSSAAENNETETNENDDTPKVTQEAAVLEALKSFKGTFKRQDVVTWIAKKYPSLRAEQRKQSIFAMLGKLKEMIETVETGKAGKPSTYKYKGPATNEKEEK
jgi:hypothetical protein